MARFNYVELPVRALGAAKTFYERAFGWTLAEFGPTYAATLTGDTDLGLQADATEATRAPLPVIEVEDLEAALAAVELAGGTVLRPIYAFPGGRRFHFIDPSGNELAVVRATDSILFSNASFWDIEAEGTGDSRLQGSCRRNASDKSGAFRFFGRLSFSREPLSGLAVLLSTPQRWSASPPPRLITHKAPALGRGFFIVG